MALIVKLTIFTTAPACQLENSGQYNLRVKPLTATYGGDKYKSRGKSKIILKLSN
jgi:hypothetical protein